MKIFSYRYLPLNIYVAYTVFVVVSLLVGPIEYKNLDYVVLLSFISFLVLLFYFGYIAGARGCYRQASIGFEDRAACYQRVKFFIGFLLFFGVISSVRQWFSFFALGGGVDFGSVGENYVKGYEGYERGQASVDFLYIVNIFDQAVASLILIFSFYYFRVMMSPARFAFLFVVITYLLINVVGTGKQKYLGDVVIFSFFCGLIDFAVKDKKFNFRIFLMVSGVVFIVFLLFIEILRQRYLAAGIGVDNIYEKTHPLINWNEDSLVYKVVASDYVLAVGIFLGYFTNGLYGLYLSLTLPFEWTFFVGNSYSLGRIVEIVTSSNGSVLEHTYPYRVGAEYGWGFDKWHSLFAWMASDITFLGVLFFAPLFAFLYARVWLQAIKASNPFAGPLFIYLSLGLIFSYANNQIMHGLSGVIVLVVLFFGWVAARNISYEPVTSDVNLTVSENLA